MEYEAFQPRSRCELVRRACLLVLGAAFLLLLGASAATGLYAMSALMNAVDVATSTMDRADVLFSVVYNIFCNGTSMPNLLTPAECMKLRG